MSAQTRTWTTVDLPASMQFAYWREVICEAFAALDPRPIANAHGRFGHRSGPSSGLTFPHRPFRHPSSVPSPHT